MTREDLADEAAAAVLIGLRGAVMVAARRVLSLEPELTLAQVADVVSKAATLFDLNLVAEVHIDEIRRAVVGKPTPAQQGGPLQ